MAHALRMRRALRPCAALLLLACAAGELAAEPSGRDGSAPGEVDATIGVLEVATHGVSQAAGDKFEESVEEGLAGVGLRVVRSQTVQQRLAGSNYISGCTFGPCMKEVLLRTGLHRVLVARIQGAGQSYSFIVSLVDTATGRLLAQVAQNCPVCTVEEAISTSTLAVIELLTGREVVDGPAGWAMRGAARERGDEAAQLERRRRQARLLGWIFAASGAVAAGLGGGLLASDRPAAGGAALGVGGGLAAAGLTALVWSRSF